MNIVYGLLGLGFAYLLVRYREFIGDILGNMEWAKWVGGIYNVIVMVAIILAIFSLLFIFGLEEQLFGGIRNRTI